MSQKIMVSVLLSVLICQALSQDQCLISIIREFHIKHPIILNNSNNSSNFQLFKKLLKENHYSKVTKNITETMIEDVPLVIYQNDITKQYLQELIDLVSSLIVIQKDIDLEKIMLAINIPINKQVIFVSQSTKEVYESYDINGQKINQKLGKFNKISNHFIWENSIGKDFTKRRSNFHGITLTAMTEATGNDLALDPQYKKLAPYFPTNKTYLVTNFVSGIYFDVLMELQRELNFTTELYKRKKKSWGFVNRKENGSYTATGIVGDLFYNKVDLIVAALTMLHQRALYIDYLMPLSKKVVGLYIPTTSEENFDFKTFSIPFR